MKALTLTQPWAQLVTLKVKGIETRSWNTSYRGELAIHAGATLGPVGGVRALQNLVTSKPFWDVLEPAGYSPLLVPACGLPLGAIVAVAYLVGAEQTETLIEDEGAYRLIASRRTHWPLDELERAFGDYRPGRYGLLLTGVTRLREPVRCRGYQKLWHLPPAVEVAVRAQL